AGLARTPRRLQAVRGAGRQPGRLDGGRGASDRRPDRPERGRQDYTVQLRFRLLPADQRDDPVRRPRDRRLGAGAGAARRAGPHLPGRAHLPRDDGARQRDDRRVCAHQPGERGPGTGHRSAGLHRSRRAGTGPRRRSDHRRQEAAGVDPGAGDPAAPPDARRGDGRAEPRRARPGGRPDPRHPRPGDDRAACRACDGSADADLRPRGGPRLRAQDCRGTAANGRPRPERDRRLSGREVPAAGRGQRL
ncbi:MAG: Branched-chain amino acid transport ATP-binding protein LivG, partial [uncultured Thermomicrobiales bacterium]